MKIPDTGPSNEGLKRGYSARTGSYCEETLWQERILMKVFGKPALVSIRGYRYSIFGS